MTQDQTGGDSESGGIEEIIQRAMQEGKFDNLPGKGKPLDLQQNPYAADAELAYKLIKDNDFTLAWIAGRAELLDDIEAFRQELARSWQWYHSGYQEALDSTTSMAYQLEWGRKLSALEVKIAALNKAIDSINLGLPLDQLQVTKLSLEAELRRSGAFHRLD